MLGRVGLQGRGRGAGGCTALRDLGGAETPALPPGASSPPWRSLRRSASLRSSYSAGRWRARYILPTRHIRPVRHIRRPVEYGRPVIFGVPSYSATRRILQACHIRRPFILRRPALHIRPDRHVRRPVIFGPADLLWHAQPISSLLRTREVLRARGYGCSRKYAVFEFNDSTFLVFFGKLADPSYSSY